ncbi:Cytochrome P450 4d2, partial [Kappamyces sp. JEL0680]
LCRHPDIQEKLYASLAHLDFHHDDPAVIMEQINECKYLDNVFKETQRLHSIVPKVPRTCTEDVTLQGHHFKKGTLFHVYIRGIHMNPRYHPNPTQFNPDRFDGEIIPGTFLPFGDGIHHCIGQKMAQIEGKVMLAVLVCSWKFTLVPGQTLREYVLVTQSLRDGLFCNITPRK